MKKLAIIIGGWHYPINFYRAMVMQEPTDGWEYEFFVVGHRSPDDHSIFYKEKSRILTNHDRPYSHLDRWLYQDFIDSDLLRNYRFNYSLEPNTIGDLEFLNQWLKKNDWEQYDMFLFAHDDTVVQSLNLFQDVLTRQAVLYQKDEGGKATIPAEKNDDWVWLSNSTSPHWYHVRNSFDFITPEVIKHVNGYFPSDSINLDRTGQTESPSDHMALAEWNKWSRIISGTLEKMGRLTDLRFLSPDYRISPYAIEGERGMMSLMQGDTDLYLHGLKVQGINP